MPFWGLPPLHVTNFNGHQEFVEVVLRNGANVRAADNMKH